MKARTAKQCVTAFLLIAVLLAGCSPSGGAGQKPGEPTKSANATEAKANAAPITLQVFQYQANITDEEFNKYFVEPIKKRYPNITLQLVRNSPDSTPEKLVASGTFPDLIFCGNNSLLPLGDLQIPLDLTALAKSHSTNLQAIDADSVTALRSYSEKNELFGLPLFDNYFATFYNKDIFDKFGVSYPKDNMTWEDMLELAKRLTRNVDGVQYRGFDPGNVNTLASSYGLPFVDLKTMKTPINTDQWKKVFNYYNDVYQIPGNFPNSKAYGKGRDSFIMDKNLAMDSNFGSEVTGLLQQLQDKGTPMNWDIATYPVFKDHPGFTHEVDVHMLAVSTSSKYPDDAYNVISYLATNKDVQMSISKDGNVATLNDPSIRQHFGEDKSVLKGKNVKALFTLKPAKFHKATAYDGIPRKVLGAQIKSVIDKKTDVNTALRTAEEEANQQLASAK
jgi:multiple sugar transport system substrate-binding protein